MHESQMTEAHKRALIIAYFLSKYDRKGVRGIGFDSFNEAFERIGQILNVKSSTVKHMRDSFDPYCSQVRAGWYQRKILPSRANVIQAYDELSEQAMVQIVHQLLVGDDSSLNIFTAPVTVTEKTSKGLLDEENAFANRLRTGEKAEAFFVAQYPILTQFIGSTIEDTRKLGIGFDFRIVFPQTYLAIEVKGVCEKHGYISFTDKEWSVAKILSSNYLLALVRSLDYIPMLELVQNPFAYFKPQMRTVESVSILWNAKV